MGKQAQRMSRIKSGGKILMWLGLLIFSIYSIQTVINWESIFDPHRYRTVMRILTQLAQPKIFEFEQEEWAVTTPVYVPCSPSKVVPAEPPVSEPYIIITPACADPSNTVTVEGFNFPPNTSGPVRFVPSNDPMNPVELGLNTAQTDLQGHFAIEIQIPNRPSENEQYIRATMRRNVGPPRFSRSVITAREKIIETVFLAFLATALSTIFAIPFTLLSTQASSGWGRGLNILLQPILAAVRAVHPLITVIFAVIISGIGPTAGVLALTLFSTAVLIDKFSEYARELPSVRWHSMLTTYFPGIAFRHFPTNLAIATVLGFVGGGGIGFLLQQDINLLNYRAASVSLLAITLTIGSLDLLSRAVWHKIQGA